MLLQLARCSCAAAGTSSSSSTRAAAAAWVLLRQQQGWRAALSTSSSELGGSAAAATALGGDSLAQGSETAADAAADISGATIEALLRSSSSSGSSLSDAALQAVSSSSGMFEAFGSFAAQPLEPLQQLLNPVVLGCSVWEVAHSVTGLPWWVSIPLTTLALRTALLPLTLKAKSAGLNFVLAQHATQTATNLVEHWKQQQEAQQQQQQQQAGGRGSRASSAAAAAASGPRGRVFGFDGASGDQLRRPRRWRLTRLYYRYYRKQHGTTSLWWWTANVAVQLNLFVAMSMALRQMAATQWPGFTDQGPGLFADLTHSSVVWPGAWYSPAGAYAPYGLAGLLPPLALAYVYLRTVEASPLAQRSVRALVGLQACVVPYFLVSSVGVPQATLLYWATNAAFYAGLQWALQQPRVASRLRLPSLMLPPPTQDKEARERAELEAVAAQQLICGSEDAGFLRYLAASYLSRSKPEPALQCLERLTVLAPGDAAAFHALGTTAAELQRWPEAARAFERAAELHAVAVEADESVECLVLAGKQWLNATAEARAQARKQRQRARGGSATAPAAPAAAAAASPPSSSQQQQQQQPQPQEQPAAAAGAAAGGKQQEYIAAALAVLEKAVHFQPDTPTSDGWYLLAMARAAAGQWQSSLTAAQTFWDLACRAEGAVQAPSQPQQQPQQQPLQQPGAPSPSPPSSSSSISSRSGARGGAKVNAAAKLLPVLLNLAKQCAKQGDYEALRTVGSLAVDVAGSGWDRSTEEQLRDTLGSAADAAAGAGQVVLGQALAALRAQLPCVGGGGRGGSSSGLT